MVLAFSSGLRVEGVPTLGPRNSDLRLLVPATSPYLPAIRASPNFLGFRGCRA